MEGIVLNVFLDGAGSLPNEGESWSLSLQKLDVGMGAGRKVVGSMF